ncbi:MAG: hypothetical protein AAGA03_13250 [Planctomycetota bacterium]
MRPLLSVTLSGVLRVIAGPFRLILQASTRQMAESVQSSGRKESLGTRKVDRLPMVDDIAKPSPHRVAIAAAIVAGIATFTRIGSCDESFWLDELHSSWVIADGIDQVASRAAAGNQTSLYFFTLWIWKQCFGDGEVAMRSSSILCVAMASVVLVVGLSRVTGQVLAGWLGGLLLALESNSLFFGSELRSYAAVMLCSSIATAAAVAALRTPITQATYWHRRWLVAGVCIGVLCHPTAAGTLVPLGVAIGLLDWLRSRTCSATELKRLRRRWRVPVLMAVGTVIWLSFSSLVQSFGRRELWADFAGTDSIADWVGIWPWVPLAIVPLILWIVDRSLDQDLASRLDGESRLAVWSGWLPLLVAVASTLVFWAMAYQQWLPLFHRRYMVAALPMLCWAAAEFASLQGLSRSWKSNAAGTLVTLVVTTSVLAHLVFTQRVIPEHVRTIAGHDSRLAAAALKPPTLVRRGEGWREAVGYVQARTKAGDQFWVDAGLIEAQPILTGSMPAGENADQYLTYPVRGPYRLSNVEGVSIRPVLSVSRWQHEKDLRELANADSFENLWVISRSHPAHVDGFAWGILPAWRNLTIDRPTTHHFGRVTVIRFSGSLSPKEAEKRRESAKLPPLEGGTWQADLSARPSELLFRSDWVRFFRHQRAGVD